MGSRRYSGTELTKLWIEIEELNNYDGVSQLLSTY